jgi:hypothetical protein
VNRHQAASAGAHCGTAVWPFLSCAVAMVKAGLTGASCGIALLGLPVLFELMTGIRLISEAGAEVLINYFMIGGAAAAAFVQAVSCWANR